MAPAVLARYMIIHFQAVLKTPLDEAARAVVLQLLAQAETELAGTAAPDGQAPRPRVRRLSVPWRL